MKKLYLFLGAILFPIAAHAYTAQLNVTGGVSSTFNLNSNTVQGTTNTYTATLPNQTPSNGEFVITTATQTMLGILNIKGTNTNDNAATGYIGEYTSSSTLSSNPVVLTNGQYNDVGSVTLTAGDYELSCCINFIAAAPITGTSFYGGVGTTAGNSGTGLVGGDTVAYSPTVPNSSVDMTMCVPGVRKSISSTTTYYLKAYSDFSAGTLKVTGRLSARRVR